MSVTPICAVEGVTLGGPSAAALYYTTPQNTRFVTKKVTIVNIDATNAKRVSLWYVPQGTAVGAFPSSAFAIIDGVTVPPLSTLDVTQAQNHILNFGDMIWAVADDAVSSQFRVSGVLIV